MKMLFINYPFRISKRESTSQHHLIKDIYSLLDELHYKKSKINKGSIISLHARLLLIFLLLQWILEEVLSPVFSYILLSYSTGSGGQVREEALFIPFSDMMMMTYLHHTEKCNLSFPCHCQAGGGRTVQRICRRQKLLLLYDTVV